MRDWDMDFFSALHPPSPPTRLPANDIYRNGFVKYPVEGNFIRFCLPQEGCDGGGANPPKSRGTPIPVDREKAIKFIASKTAAILLVAVERFR
ncbi:hypothetical protein CEXT_13111 [Caerostris extrusa]|uniref:Uncharacterized protein n=1 Tax=Caerostris extrusa TaxID=172846 RepID=A0AAV4VA32_CAEEX|nr:hypothetical protein CEXT_13111 [Caerostris extrusa]